jgi:hypothetical protein
MKIIRISFILAGIFLVYSISGFAQTSTNSTNSKERVPTIEEMYLKDTNYLAINQFAMSNDQESKLKALQEIEKLIKNKEFSDGEDNLLRILNYLSKEGVRHVVKEGNTTINYFPMVRKKASELLGLLGKAVTNKDLTRQAKDILIDILVTDVEPMVKSEAVFSLGIIGLNENGEVVKAIDYSLNNAQTLVQPDNNYAYAIILAIDKLAEANKGIKDWEAFSALVKIMQGSYNRMIKDKALEVLERIKKYQ